MKALTGLLALSFALLAVPAAAAPITYHWSGLVDRVDAGFDPGLVVGQTIAISLTLDGAFGDSDASPDRGLYDTTPATLPVVLGVDIGGDTGIGAFQTVTVLRNIGGADSIEINSSSIHTGLGFDILFQTSHAGVLGSDAIPPAIDPGDFEIATFSVDRFDAFTMFLPSFGGTIRAATVPEPASLALLSSGLFALAVLRRRQKKIHQR